MKLILRVEEKGGSGSGHHGHAGRPGEQGGSLPGSVGAGPTKEQQRKADEYAARRIHDVINSTHETPFYATSHSSNSVFIKSRGSGSKYIKDDDVSNMMEMNFPKWKYTVRHIDRGFSRIIVNVPPELAAGY